MESLLEQFRLDSIPIIARPIKWADGIEFDLEKLRYQFLDKASITTDEEREATYKLLWKMQLNLGDIEETILNRFKVVLEILSILIKDKDKLSEEFEQATNRYLLDYRRQKVGVIYAAGTEANENKVNEFWRKLYDIQTEALLDHFAIITNGNF